MKYTFNTNAWEKDFKYAYSLVATTYTELVQESDCVVNTMTNGGYNYVSIVHNEKHGSGCEISVECSFEKYGAPLVTLANSLEKDEEGRTQYGEHYEIVFWENGCNIWHIIKAPEGYEKRYVNTKTDFRRFGIGNGERINASITIKGKTADININGEYFSTDLPLLSEEFYVGLTACEGINRFYSAEIK